MIIVSNKLIEIAERMSADDIAAATTAAINCDDHAALMVLAKYDPYVFDDQVRALDRMVQREELSWGDYIYLYEQAYPDFNLPIPDYDSDSECGSVCSDDADDTETVETTTDVLPELRLRKDIWEHFPVVVLKTESADSRERHIVRWNNKRLEESANKEDILPRLRSALLASPFWTVESVEKSKDANDICVIAMNFKKSAAADSDSESVVSAAKAPVAPIPTGPAAPVATAESKTPTLRRLNDIKEHFPVVWNTVPNTKITTYTLEIFGKKAKELGLNPAQLKTTILAAVSASKSWSVLPLPAGAKDTQVCLLEMKVSA